MADSMNENSGIDLLRPLAKKIIEDPEKKSRVWSDKYEAWGFFGDRREHIDEFLIWCCSEIGDRMALGSSSNFWMLSVNLGIRRDDSYKSPVWKMKLLTMNGNVVELAVEESFLFKVGWETIGK